jgi:hypothetical protein
VWGDTSRKRFKHFGVSSSMEPYTHLQRCYSSSANDFLRVRHYATSRKVAGSRPHEVIFFFSICLLLPAALGPEVHSASNRNEYQKHRHNNVSGE